MGWPPEPTGHPWSYQITNCDGHWFSISGFVLTSHKNVILVCHPTPIGSWRSVLTALLLRTMSSEQARISPMSSLQSGAFQSCRGHQFYIRVSLKIWISPIIQSVICHRISYIINKGVIDLVSDSQPKIMESEMAIKFVLMGRGRSFCSLYLIELTPNQISLSYINSKLSKIMVKSKLKFKFEAYFVLLNMYLNSYYIVRLDSSW